MIKKFPSCVNSKLTMSASSWPHSTFNEHISIKKISSKVTLRLDAVSSPNLSPDQEDLLKRILGN